MEGSAASKSRETPWTKSISKRKRGLLSREGSDENENDGPSERKISSDGDDREAEDLGDDDSPTRKVARRDLFTTPGQNLPDRPNNAEQALPTPNTGKQPDTDDTASGSRASKSLSLASARLVDVIDLTDEKPSSLTIAVLDRIRSENVELKESLKLQIGHIIDMEMNSHVAKMQTYERTISRLSREVDKLGSMVLSLTGGEEDDPVLSD